MLCGKVTKPGKMARARKVRSTGVGPRHGPNDCSLIQPAWGCGGRLDYAWRDESAAEGGTISDHVREKRLEGGEPREEIRLEGVRMYRAVGIGLSRRAFISARMPVHWELQQVQQMDFVDVVQVKKSLSFQAHVGTLCG